MEKRVVFITGGAAGIGLEMARQFAAAGYEVMISDLTEEKLSRALTKLRPESSMINGLVCDVSREDELKSALDSTLRQFGRLDVLINNAGLQFISPVENFPTAEFDHLLRVMLVAPFIAARQVFPWMKKQQFGRIINMASINGLVGFAGKAAYNSAKHGVIGLTKVLALEGAAYQITANALCPGYVDTELVSNQLADLAKERQVSPDEVLDEVIYPLVPLRRLLSAREVARYALFLASEESGGITGQAVVIDGGYTAQ